MPKTTNLEEMMIAKLILQIEEMEKRISTLRITNRELKKSRENQRDYIKVLEELLFNQ